MTISKISHRYLPRTACTIEPWKNGLGSTDIIAEERVAEAPGEGWDGLVWRLAATEIPAALPFSDHSGYERHQVVIEGEGLYLDSASGTIDLSEALKPVQYGGELKIVSRLERGAVKVLNLMIDRGLAEGEMRALATDAAAELRTGTHLVSAVAGRCRIAVDGAEIDIANGDAVAIEIETAALIAVEAGSAVVSSVYRI